MNAEELNKAVEKAAPYFAAIAMSMSEAQDLCARTFGKSESKKATQELVEKLRKAAEEEQWRTDPLNLMPIFYALQFDVSGFLRGVADRLYLMSHVIHDFADWLDAED